MEEKYFYIDSKKARELLFQITEMKAAKRGANRHVYLIDEYAVLTASKIKLRNVTTRDENLAYFDELIKTLMNLKNKALPLFLYLAIVLIWTAKTEMVISFNHGQKARSFMMIQS